MEILPPEIESVFVSDSEVQEPVKVCLNDIEDLVNSGAISVAGALTQAYFLGAEFPPPESVEDLADSIIREWEDS